MCNALYHSADCKCGFGGEGHLGGKSAGECVRRKITQRSIADIAREESRSIVVQVRCKFCQANPIFLFADAYGGFTVFESLGIPWPKHICAGHWTATVFRDLFEGQSLETISFAAPGTPLQKLRLYFATNTESTEDWLRKVSVASSGRGLRSKLTVFHMRPDSLDSCPRDLLEILRDFYTPNKSVRREIQMLRPIAQLIKQKAQFLARKSFDSVAGSEAVSPEIVPREIEKLLPVVKALKDAAESRVRELVESGRLSKRRRPEDFERKLVLDSCYYYWLNENKLPTYAPTETDFKKWLLRPRADDPTLLMLLRYFGLNDRDDGGPDCR